MKIWQSIFNFFFTPPVSYLLTIISTLIFAFFFLRIRKIIIKWFKNVNYVIRDYWKFIIFYIPICLSGYITIILFVSVDLKSLYIDIWGQVVSIAFAIFAGYYAFLQVAENRYDKFLSSASDALQHKKFMRAISLYEDCIKIRTEISPLHNLLELYVIQKRFVDFDEKSIIYEKNAEEDQDKLTLLFLKFSKKIMLQNNFDEIKSSIKDIVDYIKLHPKVLNKFNWSFDEMKTSDNFKDLEQNTKKYYINVEKYLQGNFEPEYKTKFENGDYLVQVPPKS